jgi:NDP-sugar pyrophosphorylase family protein
MRARLRQYLDSAPRRNEGSVDPQAIVRGEIVQLGPGSVVEAGAIVHESCRLALGANSRLRAGSLVRDEVVIGADCTIGAYCEVARSLLLPGTALGHWVFVGDSVIGADNMLAGAVFVANSMLDEGKTVGVHLSSGRWDSGLTHMGTLSGDGVRFGGSVLCCPGAVVLPGVRVAPRSVVHGLLDQARAASQMEAFVDRWCRIPPAADYQTGSASSRRSISSPGRGREKR